MNELDEPALIERTLAALAAHVTTNCDREQAGLDELTCNEKGVGWAELLSALMEAFERGWIEEVNMRRIDGATALGWSATKSGTRAINAWIRRNGTEPDRG